MRILVLALLIALLPLRGWVGDAMAMELAAQALASAPAAVPAMADCHHATEAHAAGADHGGPATPEHEGSHADCHTCTSCQICHTVALTAVVPQALAPVLPAVAPRSSRPRYASAERVLGDKPPIS